MVRCAVHEPATQDQDTRDRILDAAKRVFLRQGTAGARTQEIADEAGVNKALLHYYFGSKESLAEAVFRREAGRLLPPVIEVLASDAPLEEKVQTVVALYVERLTAAPQLPAYVLSEMHFHPERLRQFIGGVIGADPAAIAPRVFGALGRQIDAAVAAGRMRPVAPDQFMVNLLSLCIFPFAARPLLTMLLGGPEQFEAFIARRADGLPAFFLGALRP